MKILMLTPRLPYPPTRGDCIRAWGELRHLSRNNDVWLASLNDAAPPPAALAHLHNHCRDVVVAPRGALAAVARGARSFLAGNTVTEGYFSSPRLARTLQEWSLRVSFDALLAFSSAMAPYGLGITAPRRILDMNDVDSVKWERYAARAAAPFRWLYTIEGRRLADRERRWAGQYDSTIVVNSRERARLDERCAPRNAVIGRTGVAIPPPADVQFTPPDEPVVGFVGSMAYPPNIRAALWFADHAWPRVRQAVPAARWEIIGRAPTAAIRRLARRPGVSVSGTVPDIRVHLRRLRVFVAPLQDDLGVQTKLIEALALARPAVVSAHAAAGMEWQGAPPFLIESRPAEFAAAVVRLLNDSRLAAGLARAAYATATQFYDVEREAGRIEELLGGGPTERARPAEAPPVDRIIRLAPSAPAARERRVG